jgi:REP element-mobilizing transposase RayT
MSNDYKTLVDKDHLHLMVTSVPKISPLQIVRKLKPETTVGILNIPSKQ